MEGFVALELRRNRGWPWPEDSWGLTPMFGEDGWCRSCGVPRHAQSGSIVLQPRGFGNPVSSTGSPGSIEGAWIPNWRFDVYCVEASVALAAADRFNLPLLDVAWHGEPPGEAKQIVAPTIGEAWFDPAELRERTEAEHGATGARCDECGVWRWLPLPLEDLPPARITAFPDDVDVAASPEWFGDGWRAFREVVFRRELADFLAAASPRDFVVREYPSLG